MVETTRDAVDSPGGAVARLLNQRRGEAGSVLTEMATAPVAMEGNETRHVPPLRGAQIPMVVLYDGDCGLCDRLIAWLLRRDHKRRFFFAPQTGDTARLVFVNHPELPTDLDSVLLLDRRGDRETVHWYADAVFRILAELDRPYRWIAWLTILPRGLVDCGYRFVSRIRHGLGRRFESRPGSIDLAEYPRFLP